MLENIDLNRSDYTLSIRVSPDGFSLSIPDNKGVELLKRKVHASLFQMNKEEIINLFEAEITSSDYNDIELIVESDLYTLIPASIFEIQNLDDYFYFQHTKDKQQIVLFNRIQSHNIINIFSVPVILNNCLNDLFPETIINHHLSYFLSQRIKAKNSAVYIWVRAKKIDMIVFKSGVISFINSFDYHTKEDLAYYVLAVCEQLSLDVEDIVIKLYQRNDASGFKDILSMYVKNCTVILQ